MFWVEEEEEEFIIAAASPPLPTTPGTIKTTLDSKPTSFWSEPLDHLSAGRKDKKMHIHLEEKNERGRKEPHMDTRTVLAQDLGLPCPVKWIKDVAFCTCMRVC